MFENMVLRRIFGPKKKELPGGWIRLHNEELHKWYALPRNIRVIITGRMRWVGHIAHIDGVGNACRVLVGNLKGTGHSDDLGVGGRIILEWILGE
jgi:hypothetical protein